MKHKLVELPNFVSPQLRGFISGALQDQADLSFKAGQLYEQSLTMPVPEDDTNGRFEGEL